MNEVVNIKHQVNLYIYIMYCKSIKYCLDKEIMYYRCLFLRRHKPQLFVWNSIFIFQDNCHGIYELSAKTFIVLIQWVYAWWEGRGLGIWVFTPHFHHFTASCKLLSISNPKIVRERKKGLKKCSNNRPVYNKRYKRRNHTLIVRFSDFHAFWWFNAILVYLIFYQI